MLVRVFSVLRGTMALTCPEAAHRELAQHFLLLARAADDLLEGGDEFLLVVDQPAQRGELGVAGELADIPRILAEQIERAFLRGADEAAAALSLVTSRPGARRDTRKALLCRA